MRYTEEQNNLHDGMIILLNLYYKLRKTDKKEWLSEPIVRLIAELVYKVIPEFQRCIYLKSSHWQSLNYFSGKGGSIQLSNDELQKLVVAMDAFQLEYGKIDLIKTHGATYQFSRNYDPGKTDKKNWTLPRPVYRNSKKLSLQILSADGSKKTKKECAKLSSVPTYHETIHVGLNFNSGFVNAIYRTPHSHGYREAISPYAQGGDSFLGLLRFFFVKYVDAFGSFERIALCEYQPCGKLLYKIRYGKGKFCCKKCKTDNHKATQDPKKFKCRARQNKWITRIAESLLQDPHNIYKAVHCDVECKKAVEKRQRCPILIKNNMKLIEDYNKKKDRPKERRIKGLKFDKHLSKSRQ